MEIYGKKYTVRELRRRFGNMDQIAGIRTVQLDDGNERPCRVALIHTGSGLELTVNLDRCMDIASARFQGKSMGWRSSTGDVAPQYFEPEDFRWLYNFVGGLLTTCGLTNVGGPAPTTGIECDGLHGRIAHIPARNLKITQEWQGNDYVLSITGLMRQTSVFGVNFALTRTISTKLGARNFHIHDEIVNDGFDKTPLMLLYHCNLGWPSLDAGSEVLIPSRYIAPRNADAEDGKKNWFKADSPTHGYSEKCYYHDMKAKRDGKVTMALVNNSFKSGNGFGVYIKYNKKQLPRFIQWKMMGEQEYVMGLEPGNCSCEGRELETKHKLLESLRPGEKKLVDLEFGPLTDAKEVKAIRDACRKVKTKFLPGYLDLVKRK